MVARYIDTMAKSGPETERALHTDVEAQDAHSVERPNTIAEPHILCEHAQNCKWQ